MGKSCIVPLLFQERLGEVRRRTVALEAYAVIARLANNICTKPNNHAMLIALPLPEFGCWPATNNGGGKGCIVPLLFQERLGEVRRRTVALEAYAVIARLTNNILRAKPNSHAMLIVLPLSEFGCRSATNNGIILREQSAHSRKCP
jgi:hypothetical protein